MGSSQRGSRVLVVRSPPWLRAQVAATLVGSDDDKDCCMGWVLPSAPEHLQEQNHKLRPFYF